MDLLAPLTVVVPVALAALVSGLHAHLSHGARHALGLLASAASLALALALAARSSDGALVHWFGGWLPVGGEPIGIAFVVQPLGAWLSALASFLVFASFLFSRAFFDDAGGLYQALVLVFLGAMNGFCLTGDLFNLFVFFELMGVCAYALTAFKNELRAPLQGALTFAVTNTVGGILLLFGIALVYARTGALNMARAGEALAQGQVDVVVLAAFLLIATGLLVKAAQVPFHFWLPDAHTVAPSAISVLFSGVMVMLGFWGLAHVYWAVFAGALAPIEPTLTRLFLAVAVTSSLFGALSALLQRDLKRLLAFTTVSQGGTILAGFALFDPAALGGAGLYLWAEGLLKGALFMCAGLLLDRHGTLELPRLHGRCRRQWQVGALMVAASVGLAGLPVSGGWMGKAFIEEVAAHHGFGWLTWVLGAAAALGAGAVLAAAAQAFLGWGPRVGQGDAEVDRQADEAREAAWQGRRVAAPAALVLLGLGPVLIPGLGQKAEWAAHLTLDHRGTADRVLRGGEAIAPFAPTASLRPGTLLPGAASALAALVVAGLWLARGRLSMNARRLGGQVVRPLHAVQSGEVGDYVVWLCGGLSALAVALALALA